MFSFCSRKMILWLIPLFFWGTAAGFATGPGTEGCGPQLSEEGCRSEEIVDSCETAVSGDSCDATKERSPELSTGGEEADVSSESMPVTTDPGAARRPFLIREADAGEVNNSGKTEAGRRAEYHRVVAGVLECAALALMGTGLVGIAVRSRRHIPKK
jgi:hypothetical protein